MDFLFPVKSNSKKDGAITFDDFKPLVKKVEKKGDLTYKDGRFKILPYFLKNRNEFSGFTAVLSPSHTEGYILKSTTEDTFEKTIFLKGASGSNLFSSEALEFVLASIGFSEEKDLYLHYKGLQDGWDVYKIEKEDDTTLVFDKTTTEEEDQQIENAITQSETELTEEDMNPVAVAEEPKIAIPELQVLKRQDEGEVGQLAQIGIEELL